VFRIATKTRLRLRLIAGTFGVALLVYLIRRAGPAKLADSMATLGYGLALVIALSGVSHLLKTLAWRLTLVDEKHHVSFPRMLGLRLASEAVGQLGFLGQVFGDTLRVSLLSPTMPLASGISSVTLDRALFALTAAAVTICGLTAILVTLPLSPALSLYGALFAVTLMGFLLITALAVRNRWRMYSGPAQLLGRIRYLSAWMERKRSVIESVENKLLDFYHHTPKAFWGSFTLNVACHGLAVLEVYLILWLMGARMNFFAALAIEALTKLVNVVGIFNPGNVGTYEGGNMLIAGMFGLSAATGLTLALARRLRAIFWAAVGGLCLIILSKSTKAGSSDDSTRKSFRKQSTAPTAAPNNVPGHQHIAVILADKLHHAGSLVSPLLRVGTLPVLLRAILGAQKAGAARIIVVVDRVTGWRVQRDLLNTQRLPQCVEWLEFGAGETSLRSVLGQLAGEVDGHLVLIAGDRTYHPSLHRRASEWNGETCALALVTGDQLVGICALSRGMSLKVAGHWRSASGSIQELHDWLTSSRSVQCEQVPEDKWQRVITPQQCLAAEDKLDRWLYKPTDGIFARMNRRVSVPISRAIISYPITPNMVSLFTLAVSFMAGAFYACGGYRNMLAGAVLSLSASVLDGCDGEIARLKLQESAFGCWLDTICDYLYYLFIFAGMMIGLWRSSGTQAYLVWGGLLFVGAIATFMTTAAQRHKLTTGRPEQYLKMWHSRAEKRSSNPFLFVGRHTEFIIRRCFLPYALLTFAIFNITNIAFILSAVGVNIVWPIALYSYRSFATVQTSTAARPAASA
jgi:phosphatidylglycerophosphate synthase